MNQAHHEEIDLVELLAKSFRALRRNLVLILICIGVAVGLAIWKFSTSALVYESRMLIYSSILTESYCLELGESLNALIRDGNHKVLAARLGLTEQEAARIRKVTMKGALQTVPEEDRLAIVVTVRTTDNGILPALQKGIMEFIAENDFVKIRAEERKRVYEELLASVKEEIEKLETVKQKMAQGSTVSPAGMLLMDPSEAYVKTVQLVEQKLELEEKLRLVNSVQLVEGFIPRNRPVGPGLPLLLSGAIVAGILLSAVVLGFKYAWLLSQRDE